MVEYLAGNRIRGKSSEKFGTTPATITKDAQNTVTNGSTGGQVTTATISMTVANNSNRVLVVASSAYNAQPDITSVTFNGSENFTELANVFDGNYKVELWFLVNPTATTANVLVNYGSSGAGQMTVGCYSFYNVKQETPTNVVEKDGNSTTTPFTAITPTTTGSMILDVYMNGQGVVASSVNKTLGWSQLAGGVDRYQSSQYNLSPTIGSSDTSLSRVLASATNGVSAAVEIKAADLPISVSDGSIFYETDNNKAYVLYDGSWSEL